MRGFFITFEGLEGAGKSTQARKLYEFLESEGYPSHFTSEPGGTPLGDAIRAILANCSFRDMIPLAELYLFSAARAQHVEKIIRPSLEEGKIVVCDRFYDAGLAYQSFGRGLPENLVRETSSWAAWNVHPDLTFYLDIEPAKGLERVSRRIQELEIPADRIEKENLEFFERVRQGYLYISREEPMRFRVFDANMGQDEINRRIIDMVNKELGKIKFKKNLISPFPGNFQ